MSLLLPPHPSSRRRSSRGESYSLSLSCLSCFFPLFLSCSPPPLSFPFNGGNRGDPRTGHRCRSSRAPLHSGTLWPFSGARRGSKAEPFRSMGPEKRVQGSGFRGQGSGVRASGSGVRGRGFGFRVHPRGGNTPGGHPGAIVRHLSPSHRSKEHGTACVPVNPPHSVPSCVLSTRAIPSRERKNEANTALTSRDASRGRNVFITSC